MKHLPNGFVLPVVLSIATVPSAWAAGETPEEALYRLTYDVRDKAGGVLAQISNYMTRNDKKTYGEQLLTLGPLCTEAVWEALRGGVALDTQIDYGTSDDVPELTSPLPLSQINEKVCLWGTDLGKQAGSAEKEAKDKKYESYMSVLKGDKKTVFYKEDLLRGGKTYYGPKRTVLKSPKDFQSASAWYFTGVDERRLLPIWELKGWRFNGDRRVCPEPDDKVSNYCIFQEGTGASVPDSAFK